MKNKKVLIGVISVLVILAIIVAIVLVNKQNEEKIKQTLTDFIGLINEKNYEAMYEKVASMNMSKEDFITRNKNIYEGIDAANLKVEINNLEKKENDYKIDYHEVMFTSAGEIQFDNTVILEKENQEYKIKWDSSFIFPQLGDNQKVRISTIKAKRGDILDRNNQILATDGTVLSTGIVPRKTRRK